MTEDLLRVHRQAVARALKDGFILAFSPIYTDGEKRLSHTIAIERGRYVVCDAAGAEIGSFATFSAADRAGLAASADQAL